ncbi:35-cyclic nucleotide phosphodiesterase family protein [Brugia malayi]|uniref:Phosphodiesterase n=1 Tax=Brugia malayi TaxID=6279 RepID=A0A0H5S4Q5_BRUMA|nr:35-cyclic nucleotide phosphodiesterase family protein [Brugia malayi]CRZ23681.1 BMA-PDE-6 [Brugia malayi]VIO99843.1 35-cyclic nucleotide phosphodiesterase family protein [Brugia malayi]
MPWCCGLANSGGTTSTALITSDSDNITQQSLSVANATGTTRRKSLIIPDNFGPMLLQPKKMALFVTANRQPIDCLFIENLRSNGWQVVKATAGIAEVNYQQQKPLLVLVDIRLPDIATFAKTMHCLPTSDEVFFAALSDRMVSEKRRRWLSQFSLCHVFVSTSTDISLCELFARLANRLRATPAIFAVLDEVCQPIKICDSALTVQYINRAYETNTGFKRSEVLGTKSSEIRRKSLQQKYSIRSKDFITVTATEGEITRKESNEWQCIQIPGSSTSQQFVYLKRNSGDSTLHTNTSIRSERSQTGLVDAPISEVLFSLRDAMTRADEQTQQILRDAIRVLSSSELYAPTITRFGNNDRIATGYYDGLIRIHHMPRTRKRSVVDAFKAKRKSDSFDGCRRISTDVHNALLNDTQWNFDILYLERISENHALSHLGIKIFERWKVHETLKCSMDLITRWFDAIEAHYHAVNPYHNATHAADVLQATSFFLDCPTVAHYVQEAHATAALIAAAVHDLDHPGRGNAFLINTQQPLALLYNDQSVLENHHIALAFQLTLQSTTDINIFARLTREEFTTLRQATVEMVLATDMSRHFEYLTKFQQVVSNLKDNEENENNISLTICRMLIKCADIGNPTREWELCEKWAMRIVEEYFDQTSEEREKGLPLTMELFDRNVCNVPLTQCGFIDMFAREAFTCWTQFSNLPNLLTQLEMNYEKWRQKTADWNPSKNAHLCDNRTLTS